MLRSPFLRRWTRLGMILPAMMGLAFVAATSFTPARAALPTGSTAPLFDTQASLGGKEFHFTLADALHHGPVVLYFYPAAFTRGCTIEAHDFADAMDEFKALGATVIGVSMDKIETLDKFSVSECRSRFAVASDASGKIATAYDSKMPLVRYASRTSYVIAPDGHILFAYSAMAPAGHITGTLAALRDWKKTAGAN
ncbi:peroxiredoxin [Gluconacetobacter azotocaptans]|uniref:thioredoxin-dependent peroxiredoxin n=1 Tax=Gluconacetobacter azotocaptans TaxID=142834 RepID=A0A7W4JUG6_9PROT|nr:peroxiredoxin [Gluconacetobacter azotocaptans]MBB2191095.1 peroxiredoxin [Gluconacetobacter azotocaptans]GBQ26548.1 thioredoxin peroxidase [Gluconacetobacter azotocaptans DSM 13594]